MYSCAFRKGWVGRGCLYFVGVSVLWQFLAHDGLHVCAVCIWRCGQARFCVEVVMRYVYIFIYSFIHYCYHESSTEASTLRVVIGSSVPPLTRPVLPPSTHTFVRVGLCLVHA